MESLHARFNLESLEDLVSQGYFNKVIQSLDLTIRNFPLLKPDFNLIKSQVKDYESMILERIESPESVAREKRAIRKTIFLFLDKISLLNEKTVLGNIGQEEYLLMQNLNFRDQFVCFVDNLGSSNKLFLIQGYPEHGQKWLYYRLIKIANFDIVPNFYYKKIRNRSGKGDIFSCIDFFRELFVPDLIKKDPHIIMKMVQQKIQRSSYLRNFFFVFEETHFSSQDIKEFKNKIWIPLTKAIRSPYRMVGFIVEHKIDDELKKEFNNSSEEFIALPAISLLKKDDLLDWVHNRMIEDRFSWVKEIKPAILEDFEKFCTEFSSSELSIDNPNIDIGTNPWAFIKYLYKKTLDFRYPESPHQHLSKWMNYSQNLIQDR